jgi:hypothetical protein
VEVALSTVWLFILSRHTEYLQPVSGLVKSAPALSLYPPLLVLPVSLWEPEVGIPLHTQAREVAVLSLPSSLPGLDFSFSSLRPSSGWLCPSSL